MDRKWPMMRLANIYMVARARSVDHRCLFYVMGMGWERGREPILGMVGLVNRIWPMMRSVNVYKVARARSVDLKSVCKAIGMTHRPKIGHVGNIRHEN